MKWIVPCVIVLFLLAACQQGGKVESTSDGANVDVSAGGADVKVNAGSGGADVKVNAGNSAADVNAGGGSVIDKLKLALSAKNMAKYTADYTTTAAGVTITMTQAFDLPKYAIESTTMGIQSKTIFDGSKAITCMNQNGWQCFELTSAQSPTAAQDSVESSVDAADAQVTSLGACSVAGESGTKYKVTTAQGSSTICYTNDGILLSMEMSANGQTVTMQATKVSRSVDASAFVPPATPQAMPSYG
jgi:hypothetical protein